MRRLGLLLMLSIAAAGTLAVPANAASSPWDGRWSGTWDAVHKASFTIADGRLVSFEYRGKRTDVEHSTINEDKLTFIFTGTFGSDDDAATGAKADNLPNFGEGDTLVDLTLQNPMHASGRYDGPAGSAYGTFTKVGAAGVPDDTGRIPESSAK